MKKPLIIIDKLIKNCYFISENSKGGWEMGKKPLQFNVPEKFRREIELWVQDKEMTLSEFLRQSARFYMVLKNYTDQGYLLLLRKNDGTSEKEIILP